MDRAELARRLQAAGAGQADGENLSATEDLLERLKKPSNRTDLSPLAAAADIYGKTGGAFQKMYKPPLSEEERLGAASKLEMALGKIQQGREEKRTKMADRRLLADVRLEDKERKEIRTQLIPQLAATKRSKLARDQEQALNSINVMETQIDMAISDKSPIVEADKYNISTLWSRVLSNSAPTQTLIEKSVYHSAASAYKDLKEYAFGSRKKNAYTKADLYHMRQQLNILKAAKQQARGTTLARVIGGYSRLLRKYPDQLENLRSSYGDLLNIDDRAVPKAKQFDAMTGNELGVEDSSSGEKKIVIKKGKEVYEISPNDLADAQKDGFTVVK